MGRSSVEINPKRGKRMQIIIKESGESNISFANKFGYTPEHISQIIIGKRRLTDDFAAKIIAEYPKYRIEWLLCIDDYKDNTELLLRPLAVAAQEHSSLFSSLSVLAQINGFSILPPRISPDDTCADEIINALKDGYTIKKGEQAITLSLEEENALENLISDYVGLQLHYLFKQKEALQDGKH